MKQQELDPSKDFSYMIKYHQEIIENAYCDQQNSKVNLFERTVTATVTDFGLEP